MRPRRWITTALTVAMLPLLGGTSDPGVLLVLDLDSFTLVPRDLRSDDEGPPFRVATGSPAHPTPAGSFPVFTIIHRPGWKPGDTARHYGAEPIPPSTDGPLGVGKIRFAADGIALHGGADPVLLGKPVSLGCVRALDEDFTGLVRWLESSGALLEGREQANGERHQGFRRRARVVVR